MEIFNLFDSLINWLNNRALILGLALAFAIGIGIFFYSIVLPILRPEQVAVEKLLKGASLSENEPISFSNTYLAQISKALAKRDSRKNMYEEYLDLLGYPGKYKDIGDLYTQAVFYGILWTILSAGFLVILNLSTPIPALLYLFVPVSGYLGYNGQFSKIKNMVDKRRMDMLVEFPSAMSAILINYNATNSLASAIINYVAYPPAKTGYLFYELKRITERYLSGTPLSETLLEAQRRTRDVPIVSTGFMQLHAAETQGTSVSTALRMTAQRAYDNLEVVLTTRTRRNQALALVPSIIAVISVMIQFLLPFVTGISLF
ncbi:MAG: type II secretion system F family protein [Methylacidiphilales bacterium]|nr:type II secretion system F family protein [Candidatus Methylacidiphilales bacterium]